MAATRCLLRVLHGAYCKLGKPLLPDATIVHVNILAFLVDNVPNAHGLAATLNRPDFLRVGIRKLTDAEIELFSDIPRSARNILRHGTNNMIMPPLMQAIYSAFFAASCPHLPLSLYPSLFVAYEPSSSCDNRHYRCGAMLSSNIWDWCQFANTFPN